MCTLSVMNVTTRAKESASPPSSSARHGCSRTSASAKLTVCPFSWSVKSPSAFWYRRHLASPKQTMWTAVREAAVTVCDRDARLPAGCELRGKARYPTFSLFPFDCLIIPILPGGGWPLRL